MVIDAVTVPEREPATTPSAALQAANERLLALRAAHAHRQLCPHTAARKRPCTPAPAIASQPVCHPMEQLPPHLGWESASVTVHLRRQKMGQPIPASPVTDRQPGRGSRQSGRSRASESDTPLPCLLPARLRQAGNPGETAVLPNRKSCLLPAAPQPVQKLPETAVLARAVQAVYPPDGVGIIASTGASPTIQAETVLKLHPSLALAMLRAGQTAAGRLWLLLRYLDENGCGWLELADVRVKLTKKNAPTRLCGQRQLRALLQQGNDLFWQRDKTRVWLFSTAKVAAGLGVGRLAGNPIALPLSVLLEPIGLVRAHLYASFHSSRMGWADWEAAPISRAALTAVSGVSRRTQHAYEQKARVQVQPNFALGPPLNPQATEEITWHHGRAAFILTDTQGKQGKPGQRYLAWRLPNSYHGPHAHLGRGRQRHLNRQLAGLRIYGDAGNGHFGRLSAGRLRGDGFCRRRYTADGVLALRCLRHRPEAWVYWQGTTGRKASFWYVLSSGVGVGS